MDGSLLLIGILLPLVGIAIRVWFFMMRDSSSRVNRIARTDAADIGLSFDERVARKLAELPRDQR